jgi:hypothetical protein
MKLLNPNSMDKQRSFECVVLIVDINRSEKIIAAEEEQLMASSSETS